MGPGRGGPGAGQAVDGAGTAGAVLGGLLVIVAGAGAGVAGWRRGPVVPAGG